LKGVEKMNAKLIIPGEYMKLNDLLGLTPDEIKNSKINLNMTSDNVECLKIWQNDNNDVKFSYWSHQGTWRGDGFKKPNRNFKVGNIVYGFVRLGSDRWLLVTVGKILEVPQITLENPHGGFCTYEIVEKYQPLFGKLIIRLRKGNTFSRYAFNLSTFIKVCYVEQILPLKYGAISFPGYDSINMGFIELRQQIDNMEWRSSLRAVNGIYLITDVMNYKKYVGSAYGVNGIYGRWMNYLDRGYDTDEEESGEKFPNSQLKLIAKDKEKGIDYIKNNFKYSILEILPKNMSAKDVIQRENYWKEVLNTRSKRYGYNSN